MKEAKKARRKLRQQLIKSEAKVMRMQGISPKKAKHYGRVVADRLCSNGN